MKELEIKLRWENGVSFEMTTKQDDGPIVILTHNDEDGNMAHTWAAIQKICVDDFEVHLNEIGAEMKAPGG